MAPAGATMMLTAPLAFTVNLAGVIFPGSRDNAKWGLALSIVTLMLLGLLVC